MTKPHEETWTTGEGALSGALYLGGGTWIGSFTSPERARLAREAPALVRMLLSSGRLDSDGLGVRSWHSYECWATGEKTWCVDQCRDARALLSEIGALP